MTRTARLVLLATLVLLAAREGRAYNVISPGDPILAIDLDFTIGSSSPGGEGAASILDNDSNTKYLNFGVTNTGFIVTPSAAEAVQSFTLTTANDNPPRDPASYVLYGTNDAITSTAHGDGRDENWIEIAMGDLALPDGRFTLADPVGFTNPSSYSSYKMIFPTVKAAANSMQIADVGFFTSMDGTGTSVLAMDDLIIPVRDVDPMPSSNSPPAEGPEFGIDRDVNTKYLNGGGERSGFIVTPSAGPTIVNAFQITTANDFEARDPASWELYGTDDTIVTENNGIGDAENWTLIDSGTVDLPLERFAEGPEVAVDNSAGAFTSYRMIFPTIRDAEATGLMQIAEVELIAADEAVLEVDRQTGDVTLTAVEGIDFDSYEIRSTGSNGLDDSAWASIASTTADPDDTWEETSPAGSVDSLAESDTPGGADNGLSLGNGESYSLGSIWKTLPTTFEDLSATFLGVDGLPVGVGVEFVGTEIPVGDYSGNGSVGAEDWATFREGYGGDYTGLTLAEAYLGGDLDGDFDSDINDFNLFVEAAGGAAALFGSVAVPEPGTLALIAGLGVVGLGLTRVRRGRAVAVFALAVCGLSLPHTADAQSFTKVGGVPTAITIPADQMNETEMSGPDRLFDDSFLDGAGIIDEELFLLDYNDPELNCPADECLQYAGLGGDPKTVFVDYGSPVTANWFAYAQRSGGDPTADRVGKFEFWFSNSDFGDVVPTTAPDAVVDLIPTDQRLLDSVLRPYSLGEDHTGRYLAMRLTMSEVSADQPVSNIGGHEFRLLSGPGDVVLEVDRGTGDMTLSNNDPGAEPIEMKSYTIESPSGALDPTAFDGLAGDSGSFPDGDGSGNGWETGGGSNLARLAEAYFSGESTLAAGASGLSLGAAYNELTIAEDLAFWWTNSDGEVYGARVEYVGEAPEILPGDYNNDGSVDARDYTVWRDNLGQDVEIDNDPTPGNVNNFDYTIWVNNFGATAGASAAHAAPEPGGCLVVACLVAGASGWRWRRAV